MSRGEIEASRSNGTTILYVLAGREAETKSNASSRNAKVLPRTFVYIVFEYRVLFDTINLGPLHAR